MSEDAAVQDIVLPIDEVKYVARRRVENTSDSPVGPPIWLISFTDVIALMLTFFVLMYAMSDPEPEKWDNKIGIMPQATAQFSGARNFAGNSEGINLNSMKYAAAENLDYLQALFSEIIAENRADEIMTVNRHGGVLYLDFGNIYKTGSNEFDNKFLLFLNALIPVLESLDNQITLIHSKSDIRELQNIGRVLRRDGYYKPLILMVDNQTRIGGGGHDFSMSLQPHDGRRITR